MSSKKINVYSPPTITDHRNFDDRYSVDVAPPFLEMLDNDLYCKTPKASRNSSLKFMMPITLPVRMRVVSFDTNDIHNSPSELEISDTVDDDSCPDDCPLSPPSVPICNIQRFCKTPPPVLSKHTEVPPLIKRRRVNSIESKYTSDCPLFPTFDLDCNFYPTQQKTVPFPLTAISNRRLNDKKTFPFQLVPRTNQMRDASVSKINHFLPIAKP